MLYNFRRHVYITNINTYVHIIPLNIINILRGRLSRVGVRMGEEGGGKVRGLKGGGGG